MPNEGLYCDILCRERSERTNRCIEPSQVEISDAGEAAKQVADGNQEVNLELVHPSVPRIPRIGVNYGDRRVDERCERRVGDHPNPFLPAVREDEAQRGEAWSREALLADEAAVDWGDEGEPLERGRGDGAVRVRAPLDVQVLEGRELVGAEDDRRAEPEDAQGHEAADGGDRGQGHGGRPAEGAAGEVVEVDGGGAAPEGAADPPLEVGGHRVLVQAHPERVQLPRGARVERRRQDAVREVLDAIQAEPRRVAVGAREADRPPDDAQDPPAAPEVTPPPRQHARLHGLAGPEMRQDVLQEAVRQIAQPVLLLPCAAAAAVDAGALPRGLRCLRRRRRRGGLGDPLHRVLRDLRRVALASHRVALSFRVWGRAWLKWAGRFICNHTRLLLRIGVRLRVGLAGGGECMPVRVYTLYTGFGLAPPVSLTR